MCGEVVPAGNQVDHGDEVVDRAITTSPGTCGLDKAVDAFHERRGVAGGEKVEDAVPVVGKRFGDVLHGRKPTAGGPAAPAGQCGDSIVTAHRHGILEGQSHAVGFAGLEVQGRHRDDAGHKGLALALGGLIAQHGVALAGQQVALPAAGLNLGAARLVHGIADQLSEMEVIVGDGGIGQAPTNARRVCAGHVAGSIDNHRRIAPVCGQMRGEFSVSALSRPFA